MTTRAAILFEAYRQEALTTSSALLKACIRIEELEKELESLRALRNTDLEMIASNQDTIRSMIDIFGGIWRLMYSDGRSWEYPGQVLNHIRQEVERLRAALESIATRQPVTIEGKEWSMQVNDCVQRAHEALKGAR